MVPNSQLPGPGPRTSVAIISNRSLMGKSIVESLVSTKNLRLSQVGFRVRLRSSRSLAMTHAACASARARSAASGRRASCQAGWLAETNACSHWRIVTPLVCYDGTWPINHQLVLNSQPTNITFRIPFIFIAHYSLAVYQAFITHLPIASQPLRNNYNCGQSLLAIHSCELPWKVTSNQYQPSLR